MAIGSSDIVGDTPVKARGSFITGNDVKGVLASDAVTSSVVATEPVKSEAKKPAKKAADK